MNANTARDDETEDLDSIVDVLLVSAGDRLAAELDRIAGLTSPEQEVVHAAAAAAIRETVRGRVVRVLVVELNAARIAGRLTAADSRARWREWVVSSACPEFWESVGTYYPTLLARLRRLVDNRCAATLSVARRFAADRAALGELLGAEPGELTGLEVGAGDSHRGGHTVAILRCTGGKIVYKPRSVAVDSALADLLSRVLDEPASTRVRVPRVLRCDGYGWAEFVEHRYCVGDEELHCYYRNLGHLLAVMRLLGGTDLHAGNLIAVGPVPTVIDCETMFTPVPPAKASGYGLAVDRAAALVHDSLLRTGLLPSRGQTLGWRGVDMSAIGSLPDQQPAVRMPVVVDAGTDKARIDYQPMPVHTEVNRPSPDPVLDKYWDVIVTGYTELTDRLWQLDHAGELSALLAPFADVPIRVVLRSTESYAELTSMLWHPESLHDERVARRRTADLLARQADNLPGAPRAPAVIDAEVEEMLIGDIPFFTTTPRRGRLIGPQDITLGPAQDLVADALNRWRSADPSLERRLIQSTLVAAYRDEGWLPDVLAPPDISTDDLDRRRRTLAAGIVRTLMDSAIRGEDGTVTWIAPVLSPTGWSVSPIGVDIYSGAFGIAVLLAGYLREMNEGRAAALTDVEPCLAAVLRMISLVERQMVEDAASGGPMRPAPVGGYVGLGSRIWAWLLLRRLDAVGTDLALDRVAEIIRDLPQAIAADKSLDLMAGMAGAVVPLLAYARASGDAGATSLASEIGKRLVSTAKVSDNKAFWPTEAFPKGIGGLSHGATGIGWALSRLANAIGDLEMGSTADAAFAYEETLYDATRDGWRDNRNPAATPAMWCHGAGGIGVVAADQLRHSGGERWRDILLRAANACWTAGIGPTHTLCHGALGTWEVVRAALASGVGPPALDRRTLDAHILGSLEIHGLVSGHGKKSLDPGLMAGLGGVAYQLLRMHPDNTLPSVLLPDPD